MSARSEYSTEAERTLAESALMLVGKVNYFWGGKSYTVGWDDRWGKPAEVTSPGHSTSGTTIPWIHPAKYATPVLTAMQTPHKTHAASFLPVSL